jgi:DNA-3-methyladenine glycosylase II
MKTKTFEIEPKGTFSLDAVAGLQCGFLRGSRTCDAGAVRIAFPTDGTFEVAGVKLGWDGRTIRGEVAGGGDVDVVARQVAHTLAVDRDGTAFERVIAADPVLRRIGQARPGFRPVVSYSPYVMAGWAVLSQRLRMTQAAKIQVALAEEAGDVIEIGGERIASFPRPQSILERTGFQGVSAEKWDRLQAVARAALDGVLERDRLNGMSAEQARAALRQIRGVGEWTADAILIRGCGPSDLLPLGERALHGAVGIAYGLDHVPDDAEVVAIARAWQPFRTWVSVLLVSQHFDAARALTVRATTRGRPRSGA